MSLFPAALWAQSTGAVYIGSDLRFVSSGATNYTCGLLSGAWLPGTVDRKHSSYFLTFKTQMANLKKQIKKASGSKKSKLEAKLKVLKAKNKKAQAACNQFNGGSNPTPTPISSGNFTGTGDVTAAGKLLFAIPSTLSANITTGKNLHSMLCSGCHGEKLGRSFNSLRSSIAATPMSFTTSDVSDSELANITAYLNRYRTN